MDTNEQDPQCIIYLLHHPASKQLYIGKSAKGMKRPRGHSEPGQLKHYAHLPRAKWIQSLKKRGLEAQIVILEVCASPNDLDEAERFHISYFRSLGFRLLNLTDGGDGINGYRHSDKARARMSKKHKARANTDEGRQRMAEMANNYWSTDEAREKKRLERLGYKHPDETKAKTSAALKGKKKSAEHCAALSEARKRNWANPEYRARQVAAQKATHGTAERKAQAAEWAKLSSHDTHRSPEYRAKQSEIAKAACASDEVRARKSDAATLKAQDPEYIEKLSIARKKWWAKRKRIPT